MAVPSWFHFMGTACACDGGCALLVSFHGHSVRLRRRLCPPCFFSWAQRKLATATVPSLFHFMGITQTYRDGCALLVSFHGHSTGLRQCLCPPGFISWAQHRLAAMPVPSWFHFMGTTQACGTGCALVRLRQTQIAHIHKKSARITSSLIRTLFSIIF